MNTFDFFIAEGMTHSEATNFTNQVLEELREMKNAGCFKTIEEYTKWGIERAYELADQWLSDYLIVKYNVK